MRARGRDSLYPIRCPKQQVLTTKSTLSIATFVGYQASRNQQWRPSFCVPLGCRHGGRCVWAQNYQHLLRPRHAFVCVEGQACGTTHYSSSFLVVPPLYLHLWVVLVESCLDLSFCVRESLSSLTIRNVPEDVAADSVCSHPAGALLFDRSTSGRPL